MAQITTAEFAEALDTDTRTVRKFLRSITPKDEQPGKGSRWVLEGNKREITKMRKSFAEWTAATEARKAEKADAPAEDAAEVDLDDDTSIELDVTDEELAELEAELDS